MSSESQPGYANLTECKRRLNIPASNTAPNEKIADNMREADNYVNTQINLHALTPLTDPDPEIVSMSSSLACTLYNYWQTPIKDRNLDAQNEWKKAIQEHILAVYGRKNPNFLAGGTTFGTTTGFTGSNVSVSNGTT